MSAEYANNAIAFARSHHGQGDLVPGRPGVDDSSLGAELAALIDGRPTPSVHNVHDPAIHSAMVRILLGGHAAASVGQGQPWQGGTPDTDRIVLVVMDLPAVNGASRSCAYRVYRDGLWQNEHGDVTDPADVIGWMTVPPDDSFWVSLMDGWRVALPPEVGIF